MKSYFSLQYEMLKRHVHEFGIPPYLGFGLATLFFVTSSMLLFYKTSFASYIYFTIALLIVSKASDKKRNDLLKTIFLKQEYERIRSLENIILTLPFAIFLIATGNILFSILLVVAAFFMVFIQLSNRLNYAIPTPFYKSPFEFIVGFRTSYVLVVVAYVFTIIGVAVGNYNLGVFSLVMIVLTSLTFYGQSENMFYVWIFDCSPRHF